MVTQAMREEGLARFNWCHNQSTKIGYYQHRPAATANMTWEQFQQAVLNGELHGYDKGIDCSAFVKFLFRVCGFRDPCGLGYGNESGYGDTQDMYHHLPHLTKLDQIHLMTLALFTEPDLSLESQHVGVVIEPNSEQPDNPLLGSHGGNNGPIKIYAQELLKYMPGREIVWLGIIVL